MIKFRPETIEAIKRDGDAEPKEMCGLLVTWASDRHLEEPYWLYVPATNVAPDPRHNYVVDAETHLQYATSVEWEIRGVVHSHWMKDAEPSAIDRDGMHIEYVYAIYSHSMDELKCWRKFSDGSVVEVPHFID